MKTFVMIPVLLIAGAGLGGGAAYGVTMLVGPAKAGQPAAPAPQAPPVFVPSKDMIAPLVFADGRLAGYVKFDIELEVRETDAATVSAKLPLLLHAVNMQTWRTPLATGPDGLLANIDAIRSLVERAADRAFGKHVVKRVAVTRAEAA